MTTPGYGFEDVREPGSKLPWAEVEGLLVEARTYWIATVRPEGQPHTAPIWGVWVDDGLTFETSGRSVKARNLDADPRCVVHVDHTEAGVIVEGEAVRTTDEAVVAAYVAAYGPKYGRDVQQYLSQPNSAVFRFTPNVGFSFREFLGQTATRWEF